MRWRNKKRIVKKQMHSFLLQVIESEERKYGKCASYSKLFAWERKWTRAHKWHILGNSFWNAWENICLTLYNIIEYKYRKKFSKPTFKIFKFSFLRFLLHINRFWNWIEKLLSFQMFYTSVWDNSMKKSLNQNLICV